MNEADPGAAARYFVKADYEPNEIASTMDAISGGRYWSAARQHGADLYQAPVYSEAARIAEAAGARLLVDVGCGVGTKLAPIHARLGTREPRLVIVGIDQPAAIEACRAHHGFGTWIVDDFENPAGIALPGVPDVLVCADVIEHVRDPDRLLGYLRNLAGPETAIVISTPERDALRGPDCRHCPHPDHIREWNAAEFRAYVEDRGFRVRRAVLLPAWPLTLRPAFLARDLRQLLKGRSRRTNQLLVLQAAP